MSDTQDKPLVQDQSKRDFMKKTTGISVAAALMALVPPGVRQGAWAAGSDAPEKPNLNIGFIPLTDCASVVMASVKGFDKKYGLTITPSKEASWAAVRDKLVNGELDAAHVLYGLIYGVQLGIGGPKKDMAVLLTINNNGQAITLSNQLQGQGRDRRRLAGQADRRRTARNTPSPRPSPPAPTRCGCTTGWRPTASTRSPRPR